MKRVLISVSDKTGIVDFSKKLAENGYEIISTGGTAKALEEAGLKVIGISEVTGFPECLDGRVKTLHPAIHAGLLAMRANEEHMAQIEKLGIKPIDMVVVNLYPFKQTVLKEGVTREEAIENIDIGGPTMLRAAAKNWQDVAVVTDPADYDKIIEEISGNDGCVSTKTKFELSAKVFAHTAHYDSLIASYMAKQAGFDMFTETMSLTYEKVQDMRYGENPHQRAAFYKEIGDVKGSLAAAKQLHGKELSFNNINDANGALELLKEYEDATVVACKHANPCGVGSGDTIYEAYTKAYNSDPVSVFGGIIAANREIDEATAEEINKIFIEIVIAPSFSEKAVEILSAKKNIRLLELPSITEKQPADAIDIKKVAGGILVQEVDRPLLEGELQVVTKRKPTEKEMEDMLFAWKMVKFTKSNGITIAKDKQSVGIGPGQVNRIWACKQAIEHGTDHLGADVVKGAALASDAFFPFPDCVEECAKAGITAIIQPGGSIKDQASIDACDEHGIAMVFTGMRHFRH